MFKWDGVKTVKDHPYYTHTMKKKRELRIDVQTVKDHPYYTRTMKMKQEFRIDHYCMCFCMGMVLYCVAT